MTECISFLPHIESFKSFFKKDDPQASHLHKILDKAFPLIIESKEDGLKEEEIKDGDLKEAIEELKQDNTFDPNILHKKKSLTLKYKGYKGDDISKTGLDEYSALRYFETIKLILRLSFSHQYSISWFYDNKEIHKQVVSESEELVKVYIPEMNERGSFIIKGIERVPIAQLLPKDPNKEIDDPNHLKNKNLLLIGDHLEIAVNRAVREIKRHLEDTFKKGSYKLDDNRLATTISAIFNDKINDYFTGELCQILDQTNPLSEVSHKRKITCYGPNGIAKEYRGIDKRDVHYSHYGRICPVETPESIRIGLTLHFATHARVRDKQILSPIKSPDGEIKYMTAEQEETLTIAPYSFDGKKPAFVRQGKDEMITYDKDTKSLHSDCYPEQFIGIGASLIPFIQHDDVNRALMGAKNLKQSLPLKHPEQPIVKTGFESLTAKVSGRLIYAEREGVVKAVSNNEITIRHEDFSERTYTFIPINISITGTTIFQKPIVRVGDEVKEGQCLTEGSCIKDGELALGVNLLVAYMPWYGYNFEDGIVISDRLVTEDILTSLHTRELIFDIQEDEIVTKVEDKKTNKNTDFSFDGIGEEGYVKVGQYVEPGDPLICKYRIYKEKNQLKKGEQPIKIFDVKCLPQPIIERADDDTFGTVVYANRVKVDGKEKIVIWLEHERKVKVGDKLMGRHGNKGIISKILPQSEMPRLSDGTPVDVILNPHGVISRMNLGQLLETHLGLTMKHKGGSSVIVRPFEPFDIEGLKGDLAEIGYPDGKAILYNNKKEPITEAPVTVGWQYMVKLNHLAEEKEHARLSDNYSTITQQAPRGKQNKGGQRIGEMEEWALIAHGAYKLLEEFASFKADDVVSRKELMQNLSRFNFKMPNMFMPKRTVPESFRVFLVLLKGLGAKPTLVLQDDREVSDFDFLPAYEIKDIKGLKIQIDDTTSPISQSELIEEAGLYKIRKFGELSCGCKGYFDDILFKQNPIICKKHTRVLLSCGCRGTLTEIATLTDNLIKCKQCNKDVEIQNTLVTLECGCDGVYSKTDKGVYHCSKHKKDVKAVDKIKELWSEEREMNKEKGIFSDKIFGVKKEITRRQKWAYIELAEPLPHPIDETKTLKYLPVIPPELRPVISGSYWGSDLNYLYNQVIIHNNKLKQLLESKSKSQISDYAINKVREKLIQSIKALMIDGYDTNGRHYNSILDLLNGKEGLFRQAMLGKRIDFSARGVIVPAPDIRLDEVKIPIKMAKELFLPWLKEALRTYEGMISEEIMFILNSPISKITKNKLINTLNRFINENEIVVVLNRAPSLHRYNFLAFRPIVTDEHVIGLHPLVCNGFNADFDGDQMGVYLPLVAQKEARELLDPYRHVLSIANAEQMLHFSQDIVAGLFLEGISKKQIKEDIKEKYSQLERTDFIDYVQALMQKGFTSITKRGLTISLFDFDSLMVKSSERERMLSDLTNSQWEDKDKLYETWKGKVKEAIESNVKANPTNPVSILCTSGARGDINTLTQLAGMRGMMEGASEPVRSNFREGLNALEFFICTHGSRSSLADKKLKVAVAGYFTRRLIYSTMELLITEDDCQSNEGIILNRRLYGRYALEDVAEAGIKNGEMVTKEMEGRLKSLNRGLIVRSPVTCKSKNGICKKCYGIDLSTGKEPVRCLAVGVIAGESIGERGTQLSMRTFHTGGVKGAGQSVGLSRVEDIFENKDNFGREKLKKDGQLIQDIVKYYLDELNKEYKNAIDDIHFEVIIRSMLHYDEQGGYDIRGITQVSKTKPDLLSRIAFQRAKHEIQKAISKGEYSSFDTIKAGLLLGGYFDNILRRCKDV